MASLTVKGGHAERDLLSTWTIPQDQVRRVIEAFVNRLEMAGLGFERRNRARAVAPDMSTQHRVDAAGVFAPRASARPRNWGSLICSSLGRVTFPCAPRSSGVGHGFRCQVGELNEYRLQHDAKICLFFITDQRLFRPSCRPSLITTRRMTMASLFPPDVEFRPKGMNGSGFGMKMSVNGHRLKGFPALNGSHIAIEVASNFLPGIESVRIFL
jgi:hypothetical protein